MQRWLNRSALVIVLTSYLSLSLAQELTQWTEAPGILGLGYAVPIPQDNPLPFDGFRSYAALHIRHQDLMITNEKIQGSVVGTTVDGRDIWAYRLSDEDSITVYGLLESAMLTNGGIHAREWQSPEVLTGVMELFDANSNDNYLYQYLMENANIILIPVNNVDGLLQTQRFPQQSWMVTLPVVGIAPRDGRMRRKNMRNVDEDIISQFDLLLGVDLNRNNQPFWNTGGSSSSSSSIVYHGPFVHSEPETLARLAAAELGPANRLRMYTDVHSFTQVYFSVRSSNQNLNRLQNQLLSRLSNHYRGYPKGKIYTNRPNQIGVGIGATDEYFSSVYNIPSWTLEIEPTSRGGLDYGGLGSNGHDGFILPESEIRRVREQLSENFMIAYYNQAGPPSLTRLQIFDELTDTLIFDAEWDLLNQDSRELYSHQYQMLLPDRNYNIGLSFDKPMRFKDQGDIVNLQGHSVVLDVDYSFLLTDSSEALAMESMNGRWSTQKAASLSYVNYQTDTYRSDFIINQSNINQAELSMSISVTDMLGVNLDADPSTVVDWKDGEWSNFEGTNGSAGIVGGSDTTIQLSFEGSSNAEPFRIDPTVSGAWYDLSHSGEGILIEVLSEILVQIVWFTYTETGQQRWFLGTGEIKGNQINIDDVLVTRGPKFGDEFDANDLEFTTLGNVQITVQSCDSAQLRFETEDQVFRQNLSRLTTLLGYQCGQESSSKTLSSDLSGSWFDPSHKGEGLLLEVLTPELMLVNWFSYDASGQQAWFFGLGELRNELIVVDDVSQPIGGNFGSDFDPNNVELIHWGSLELNLACEEGTLNYQSVFDEFGSGNQNLKRFTRIFTSQCSE